MVARSAQDQIDLLTNERWTAGVIGLGYVGLPLLMAAVRRGLGGVGYDVSEAQVDTLNSGRSPVDDVSDEDIEKALADEVLFTTDPSPLSGADVLFLCVPQHPRTESLA